MSRLARAYLRLLQHHNAERQRFEEALGQISSTTTHPDGRTEVEVKGKFQRGEPQSIHALLHDVVAALDPSHAIHPCEICWSCIDDLATHLGGVTEEPEPEGAAVHALPGAASADPEG